jgi:hypothetical protein
VTSFVLGAGALAFGLSFGFGTRDIVRNIAAGFYARKILVIGRSLEIAGQRGTLRAITATHVVLTSGDQKHHDRQRRRPGSDRQTVIAVKCAESD